MKYLLLIFLAACAGSPQRDKKVILIKQWHLSPSTSTMNVSESKKLLQFENQMDIYQRLVADLKEGPLTLIGEGCEAGTPIDRGFTSTYNGWNFTNLQVHADRPHYDDILTYLPLKLKAKFPDQVTAVCGDRAELVKENALALSEAKGYLGFFYRLTEHKNNLRKFTSYLGALEETEKQKIDDPIAYSEKKAIEHVSQFWRLIKERNQVLVKSALERLSERPVIIVGGLHLKDLEEEFKKRGVATEVWTPKGYPIETEKLGENLLKDVQHQ